MYLAYVRERVNGRYTLRVYYQPGFAGEVRGLVSIVPNRDEFEAAAWRFPSRQRTLLTEYLSRGFGPYEPVTTELRFNESALAARDGDESPISPVRVSRESSAALSGRPAYRVRLVEPCGCSSDGAAAARHGAGWSVGNPSVMCQPRHS